MLTEISTMPAAILDQRHMKSSSRNRRDSAIADPDRSYVVRYRSTDRIKRTALIVEDASGTAYLFCEGELRLQRAGEDASARLKAILSRQGNWTSLPRVAPYSLADLRALVGEGISRE
jgi:hypothetical protein